MRPYDKRGPVDQCHCQSYIKKCKYVGKKKDIHSTSAVTLKHMYGTYASASDKLGYSCSPFYYVIVQVIYGGSHE